MQQATHSPEGPSPIGPYSPAIVWNELVFVSGQGPLDPASGRVVEGDFRAQVVQTLQNIDALLRASGSGRESVLKVHVYLVDLGNFATFNDIYADFFRGSVEPARTTVQVAKLPGGIAVEVDAIAYRRGT